MKESKTKSHGWAPFRADERSVRRLVPHAPYRLALAYATVSSI